MKGKEIHPNKFVELLRKGEVYLYNDFDDIVYRAYIDGDKVRYFAKKMFTGQEYEVFTETSNVLMDTLEQPILITKEDYNRA